MKKKKVELERGTKEGIIKKEEDKRGRFNHAYIPSYHYIQRVQEKLWFILNSLQPFPRLHRCKRPSKLSRQCECTVTPIGC